jgi:ParB/RepB/Spo0J family partition protein
MPEIHQPPSERLEHLSLSSVHPSTSNPRTHFDDRYLSELATSITEKGLLQPITVRPKGKAFEIVAGECRYRATKLAKLDTIAAIVRPYTDEQVLELQLIENIHRRDLSPLEQARGYRALIDTNPTKHSAESIASRIGMSPQWVWDRMKLNDLVPEAKKLLEAERMTVGHAILIARLKPADQTRVIDPGKDDGFRARGRGGLWTDDHARLDELDARDDKGKDKYDGLKAQSIRELESWINDHIRFDVDHMAKAAPLDFEPVAERVHAAEAKPGRRKKVIAISFEYHLKEDARDESERTFGPTSWRRADGTKGTTVTSYPRKVLDSPSCDHAVLGVVAAGERRGEAFDVCIARDKCEVHWKKELQEKAKRQKQRDSGKPSSAEKRAAADRQRQQREDQRRRQQEVRWDHFYQALRKSTRAAAAEHSAVLPKALYARVMKAFGLPDGTKPAALPKALLERVIAQEFRDRAWHGDEKALVEWAKLLGVDVKACEPTHQTPGEKAKDKAKAGKGKAAA